MSADAAEPTLVPARIINEHVYCPRLAWLEWEARAFVDNADTAEGTDAHRRVDAEQGRDGSDVLTSLSLSSQRLGLSAKLDKVELREEGAIPVETKHGKPARRGSVVREPELAQITVQALLLREAGYEVPHGEVFFTDSRQRVRVDLPGDAEDWIGRLVTEVRENASQATPPAPLVDSPKCPRCSLVSVCLPDETNLLRQRGQTRPRRLVASDNPAKPLYVMTPGAFVRKRGGRLVLEVDGETVADRRLLDVSHLAVFGNVTVGSAALRACLETDVPVLWFSSGGWFAGYAIPHGGSWVARRMAQYRIASDEPQAIRLAARFVDGKIRNQRTLLRRLGGDGAKGAVASLAGLLDRETEPVSLGTLLGVEGAAARMYFQHLPSLLKRHGDDFVFEGRNRRPATDPVNAMLSFAYALLVRDTTVAALAAGLDPQVGLLHQPRFGRPSLALDLAEEFRPLVADSTVITAINNAEVRPEHFVARGGAVALTERGRKGVINAYERRVAVQLEHPLFGYKTSYRRTMELQARQLAAVFDGQFDEYRPLTTR